MRTLKVPEGALELPTLVMIENWRWRALVGFSKIPFYSVFGDKANHPIIIKILASYGNPKVFDPV
jgi:hypothetical protein